MKTSNIFFIIAGVLLLILIAPYIYLVPMSMIGIEVIGVKIFAKGLSERNVVLMFLTIATALIGASFKSKGK